VSGGDPTKEDAAPPVPAIEATALVKRFGDTSALDGLDLRVESGRVHGLVGPNGAGKTTLLRALFGLIRIDGGSIRLLGGEVSAPGSGATPGVAGFVEEPRFYPYLGARRNLELLARLDGEVSPERIDEVLDIVRLSDRGGDKVGGFSSGMRQRLGFAASLLRPPRLLLLDEPTAGLDPAGAREMRDLVGRLASEGTTVLMSSHDMNELDGLCDAVTVLRSGRNVWEGSMDRLRAEAPAPAHRLWTSDDARAADLARSVPDVKALPDPDGWLTVEAGPEALDAFVIALGRAGIAVRRLELLTTALESLFFALTGSRAEEQPSHSPAGDMRAST
jgi:ABC-2 type transport system ATP-binding protein